MFELSERPVELSWQRLPAQLRFVIRGDAGQRPNLDELRGRLVATAADHVIVRYDAELVTVDLGFDL